MTTPPPSTEPLPHEKLELFRMLYPIFKDEVFRRREHMMRLSAFASSFLVLLLVTIVVVSPWPSSHGASRWFAISGVALFTALFAFLILQQAERHRMAKQQLITMEQALKFYEKKSTPNGTPIYPQQWETDWLRDRSVFIYLAVLSALTALVIGAMLVDS